MVDYIIPIGITNPVELQIHDDNFKEKESSREKITIIGTGNYGIALGKRLISSGYEVLYGSRDPNEQYLSECFDGEETFYSVTTISDAWKRSHEIIFLAVSFKNDIYDSIIREFAMSNASTPKYSKIIVDISNRTEDRSVVKEVSNAEKLENLIRSSDLKWLRIQVVKGFNLISAYTLGISQIESLSHTGGSQAAIPICGNDQKSKEKIKVLIKKIGYEANDIGDLKQALKLEDSNTTVFSEWLYPSIFSFLFFIFNFVWIFIHYFYFPKKQKTFVKYLEDFSLLSHLNKVLGFTSLQLLAWVYFGSILASIVQLINGTKYKRFPKLLDAFLKNRKQYGLWAFLFASVHIILTMYVTNPGYLGYWFTKTNEFSKLTLMGDLSLITGTISYILFVLIALSSISSIAKSFNWQEWNFVQTKIGLVCLLFGLIHTAVMYLNIFLQRNVGSNNYSVVYLLTRVKLYGVYFPFIVLLLRLVFILPPLNRRIEDIRSGAIVKNQKELIDAKA